MGTSTLLEINIRGIEALKKALDPLELVRFFKAYKLGSGNYTEERKNKFKNYSTKQIGYSILIDKVFKFKNPIDPKILFDSFTPPQSFCYYEDIH